MYSLCVTTHTHALSEYVGTWWRRMSVGRRRVSGVVWAVRGEIRSWQCWEGFNWCCCFWAARFRCHSPRVTTCCQSSLSRLVVARSVLIKLRAIASITHSTVFVSSSNQNIGTMPERRPFVRLPTDVYPVNYGLSLKPDLIDFTFEGKLEALVEVCWPRHPRRYTNGFICAWRGSRYVIWPANVTSC